MLKLILINRLSILFSLTLFFFAPLFAADKRVYNYDEEKVLPYELPNVLQSPLTGKIADSPETWENFVRPDLIVEFEKLYSKIPPQPQEMRFEVMEVSAKALGGKATRKQIRIHLKDSGKDAYFDMLIYIPNDGRKKHKAFMGLNFVGNHSVAADEEIILSSAWSRNFSYANAKVKDNKTNASHRGAMVSRWPIEKLVESGYAVITAWYCEIFPDKDDGAAESVYKIFSEDRYKYDRCAITAWAWAMMRMMDYVSTDADIDAQKVLTIGHSRLGKTAIWAAACDRRFAGAISNNSGCMGAALSKRDYGETVSTITKEFPHWFSKKLAEYSDNEAAMPVDQHQLLALIAPRPLYVASATLDKWADPKGELLSLAATAPVYKLFGLTDIPAQSALTPEQPFIGRCAYHLRTGKHDITIYDWENYIKFADKNL